MEEEPHLDRPYRGIRSPGEDPRGIWLGCLIVIFLLLLIWGGGMYLLSYV